MEPEQDSLMGTSGGSRVNVSPRSWRPRDKQADHEELLKEELQ